MTNQRHAKGFLTDKALCQRAMEEKKRQEIKPKKKKKKRRK
jgi:hypothetical protein